MKKLLLLFFILVGCDCQVIDRITEKKHMEEVDTFVKTIGFEVIHINCYFMDCSNELYYSCRVFMKRKNQEVPKMYDIYCHKNREGCYVENSKTNDVTEKRYDSCRSCCEII